MQALSPHWADQAAQRVIKQRGDKPSYTVASGITPSGVVHIGNFREVITVDLIARSLRRMGKKVRFIYSWDDFDTFRKVPPNLPQQEMLATHLRRPISRVPDPFGTTASYAAHNIAAFEQNLPLMGIEPEFLYQHDRYSAGVYAKGIRHALEHKDQIRAILDTARTEPLASDWLPTAIYCEQCDRDAMHFERYDGEWNYSYHCRSCDHQATTDLRYSKNIKLNWRTDWPMRWAFEQVDFEPGGKDHSSDGGSYATGKIIAAEVYHWPPPIYVQYDFVSIKGGPGKMSSSSGSAVDLAAVLEVYSPEMIRWIFARQKPNSDFSIAFDEDVIKLHDEFDRCEEQAYAPGDASNQKWLLNRRIYELSLPATDVPAVRPYRPPFRILTNRLQICGGDAERTLERYYQAEVQTAEDRSSFLARARRASVWLEHFAPDDFRYALHAQPVRVEVTAEQSQALRLLIALVKSTDLDSIDPKELNQAIYDRVVHAAAVDPKAFFTVVYQTLIGRDQGPRLPGFLKEIGQNRLLELLSLT